MPPEPATASLVGPLVGGIVGGLVSIATTAVFRFWQYRQDRWFARVDHVSAALERLIKDGQAYWISKDWSNEDARKRTLVDEHRILTDQMNLNGAIESLLDRLQKVDSDRIRCMLGDFISKLTGDGFQSKEASADTQTAALVGQTGNALLLEIWRVADCHAARTPWSIGANWLSDRRHSGEPYRE